MRLYQLFALATIAAQASAAAKTTVKTQLNGWYKCSDYTFSDEGSSDGQYAECATFIVPLCYPGICKTPHFADPTIDVFVKRMLATNADPKTATNAWLLQGGPGFSSSSLEASMVSLFTQLDGTANIYTMDYRGVGRSTFLDCVAAQATTSGSPNGREFDPTEVPACAQELQNKYGDLAAFSVTSAATDLVTFMSKYTSAANTIVYGTSYGTVVVERVIHLNPQHVVGYVLDGIATTSGAPIDKTIFRQESELNVRGNH
ncbi:putative serine protease family S33 [Phytophthora cinnamomi]|uniref:putative serine protease family S33 n=1 Tax=Phytophthora cinnamomi TaxID=4785 RepID=UPI00355A0DFE|nr:putative serine protease family S33 [Phytophthora cinnamomi]